MQNSSSVNIKTSEIAINLEGTEDFVKSMFDKIMEEIILQLDLIPIQSNGNMEEEMDDSDLQDLQKLSINPSEITLDEFRKNYRFVKPQEKVIITALWLTKIRSQTTFTSFMINKMLDEGGFRKVGNVTQQIDRLHDKKMLTYVKAATGTKKVLKLTLEDIEKIEMTYKIASES